MESKRERNKNIYLSIGLILFAFCVTGATYAYFALTASNNAITGTVGGATLTLTVNKIVPTTQTTNMIPQLESTLDEAISSTYNCVDDHDNVVCQVYKATITNTGQATAELKGTIAFAYTTNSTYTVEEKLPNLKWKRITDATTIGEYNTYQALTTEQAFEESKVFAPGGTEDYYFVVWIDETGEVQSDSGTFNAIINFESADGEGITSTIRPESEVNAPNLDNNNLIPVYYDNTNEVWKKADSTNANNSWYNYDNKEWANAVLIKDDTARVTYQSATKDTPITESDISGFLVWIPRYKYRVWNITRQGGTEDTYAYPAYTNGIDIEWESGTESTDNVECDYNVENSNPSTTLSDVCTVNGTTITPESGNTNFTDAWYTHPAFTFNSSNKTGFWIGKFETTGTADVPTVLPDTRALTNQNVSTQFTTSRVFQTYGLSSSVNAHMLTNLEWGAMAYLTHSIYGLCDGTSCRDTYNNNSSNNYTGRSAGVLGANSGVSSYGTYNYKGYPIDSSTGLPTGTKDEGLVASTTGNITGIYDISGGRQEHVMANQVDSSNNFNPSSSGNSWAGSTDPSTFYYNAYSYGESDSDQTAFNRAYLGDATAETTGGTETEKNAWQPGIGITYYSSSIFVDSDYPWFHRGGFYNNGSGPGSFSFCSSSGIDFDSFSFRLSIS